jgi:hypothetical protein
MAEKILGPAHRVETQWLVTIWTLLADEYPGSPLAGAELSAVDAAGRRFL